MRILFAPSSFNAAATARPRSGSRSALGMPQHFLRPVLASRLCADGDRHGDDRSCNGCSVLRFLDDLGPKILGTSKLPCIPRTGLGLDAEHVVELLDSERKAVAVVDNC